MSNCNSITKRTEAALRLCSLFTEAAQKGVLRKGVCSKPHSPEEQRTVITCRQIGGRSVLQAETFKKDNKAIHQNIPLTGDGTDALCKLLLAHGQVNLLCEGCECEFRSKSEEKWVLLGADRLERFLAQQQGLVRPTDGNNREKKHILDGSEPFLVHLGVADKNGRVFDRKQAKFRQINRFLELIRDVEDRLPSDRIRICDLCCGKSYLSFAAYHYFSNVKKMTVSMTGVDLKPDVIEHCQKTARLLGFDGLDFVCGDISAYEPGEVPQLVISLHACDIATDLVLTKAAEWGTDVILSTPCCHHELNHHIACQSLSFITD